MEDLKNSLLEINLSDEIIDQLYKIIFGAPPTENLDASYDYTFSEYQFFRDYKASYIVYRNSIGLFSVASASEKSAKVINYINNLLTQLTTQPDFWSKLAEGIRKQKYTFSPKLIQSYTTDENGAITKIVTKQDPKQDYRVYTIDAVNTFTGRNTFNNKNVSEVSNGRKVVSRQYAPTLVGYLDPSVFGGNGFYKSIVYSEVQVDPKTEELSEIKRVKTIKPSKNEYKRLMNNNGYYFKSDLKLVVEPNFLSKTFRGGLYVNVKNVGYKLMVNFQ
ncbi:MAG: hypothetical protein KA716_18510 [Gloeotrichia echinulata DEX184]|jgi:hypothetical protein|nr:hypothetical protein [Gloeotrichia echinulata DEX184]